MSKATERKRRKRVREEAMAQLMTLTTEQLNNLRHEIGREMGIQSRHINDLRIRLDAVRTEMERRSTMTTPGIHISDHALVRYMERIKGVDVRAIRDEIGAMALRARTERDGRTGRRRDPATGYTLGVDETTTVVTTIFQDDELPVMKM